MTKRYWHDLVDGSLVENIPLAELTTDPATDVTENSATLNGTIDGVEGTVSDEKEYFFEYGEVGQGFPEQTDANTTTQSTPFSYGQVISALSQNTDYEFRAAVTVEGETFTGGTQTFTTEIAIPDSAIHRWPMGEGSGTTTADAIGTADGSISGATWTSGTWIDDYALDFDGTDDEVSTSTLGTFGSNLGGTWAVSFTIQYSSQSDQLVFWGADDGDVNTRMALRNGGWFGSPSEAFTLDIQNENNNNLSIATDSTYVDGNKHRVVVNGDGTDASNVQMGVDGSFVSVSTYADGSIADSYQDFARAFHIGSDPSGNYIDATIDDLIIYDSHLSSTQVQDDYNRQPWS